MRRRSISGVNQYLLVIVTVLFGACAQAPMRAPPDMAGSSPQPVLPAAVPDAADPMADVEGDRALPGLAGAVERYDCKVGTDDLQARMAVEARGGQVASFAYYSKWRPRTCSLDMQRDAPFTKWRLTAEGATRVQTPHGWFLIRALDGAWEFEFQDVEREKFCGMDGYTNGTMRIGRGSAGTECSVVGLLDRDGDATTFAAAVDGEYAQRQARMACEEGAAEWCGPPLYPAPAADGH